MEWVNHQLRKSRSDVVVNDLKDIAEGHYLSKVIQAVGEPRRTVYCSRVLLGFELLIGVVLLSMWIWETGVLGLVSMMLSTIIVAHLHVCVCVLPVLVC